MAPAGALRKLLTPGLDPMALFMLLSVVLQCVYGLPAKSERLISLTDRYYQTDQGYRCELCPPGTFVKKPCTIQNTSGECEACPSGTYSAFFSGMSECLSCSTCRDDQEEVSSCTSKNNTVCQCKKGTFCPPDQPCEICVACKTDCPEDQHIKDPCSSTSDLLCTTPSSPSSTSPTGIIITAAVVAPLLIIGIVVCVYWKSRNNNKGCKVFRKLPLPFCSGEKNKETQNPLLQNNTELHFAEGRDENEIFSRSFVIIDHLSPIRNFDSVMLRLGLDHNDLYRAKEENPNNVHNQHTAMLNTLKERDKFNINVFLQALQELGLKKSALNIAKQLVEDGLYTERPSSCT